jgi:hypothetical protein
MTGQGCLFGETFFFYVNSHKIKQNYNGLQIILCDGREGVQDN